MKQMKRKLTALAAALALCAAYCAATTIRPSRST